ncbi:MAG: 30S ribosomal protein S8 [Candidatus Aenigmarchaeota archaeon]|nr:30S ribosomal protein S8 [Candidatus Aenigmarchaeota archaeon]
MRHDLLADTMSTIKNAEKAGKKECLISPTSKLTVNTLNIMKKEGFIKSLKFKETSKGGQIEVELIGRINQCKAIKPRHSIKKDNFMKFEKRYLPASDIGILIVSTPQGIKSHKDIKGASGGILLAFVY